MSLAKPASRRLVTAALAAAPGILRAQSAPNRMKVAFIGVGNRGGYVLKRMLELEGADIVAICDLDETRARAAAEAVQQKGGKPALYTDYRKMLEERKEIEAVVVATPVDTHLKLAIAVLEAGKHLYAEKPVAGKAQECDVLVKAAQSAKGIYQAGFQLRHDPNRNAAMKFVLGGGIGRVLYAQGYRHTGDLPRDTPWLFDRSRSGDNIVEQACHILDLFTWAVGKPPLRAAGLGGISLYQDVPPGRTVMDNYSVMYEFPGDIRVNFSHIYFDPPGFAGIKERIYGSEGAVDLASAKWVKMGQRGEIALEVPPPPAGGDPATLLSLKAFLENARERRQPLNDAASARLSTLVAILGRTAIYEKRVVEWKEVAG
jgi:predicted dehydrogenase